MFTIGEAIAATARDEMAMIERASEGRGISGRSCLLRTGIRWMDLRKPVRRGTGMML